MTNSIKYEDTVRDYGEPDEREKAYTRAAELVFRAAKDTGVHDLVKFAYYNRDCFDWCEYLLTVFDFETMPSDNKIYDSIQEYVIDRENS